MALRESVWIELGRRRIVDAELLPAVLAIECMLVARDRPALWSPLELTGGAADPSMVCPAQH